MSSLQSLEMLSALAALFQQLRLNRRWIPIPWIEAAWAQYRLHHRAADSCGLHFSCGLTQPERDRCSCRASPPVDEPERWHAVARLCPGDHRLGCSHSLRQLCLSLARAAPSARQDESNLGLRHGRIIPNWQYSQTTRPERTACDIGCVSTAREPVTVALESLRLRLGVIRPTASAATGNVLPCIGGVTPGRLWRVISGRRPFGNGTFRMVGRSHPSALR
jgi:hypothetical protein